MFYKRFIKQKPSLCFLTRPCSNDFNKPATRSSLQKTKEQSEEPVEFRAPKPDQLTTAKWHYWNEEAAVRKELRENTFPHSIHRMTDFARFLQSWNNFPTSFADLKYLLKKRYERRQLIEQKFLERRAAVLKPDLAAAHFIVRRGGSIKFVGNPQWIGFREKNNSLPPVYTPGLFIEGIKAEGTSLIFEGLPNLSNLVYLSYLSFKNLDTVNDWFLDYLSQEHHSNLKHLDISGCKNVTYRGLSCFYRFERLEVLEVDGIPDTTEFKLACLMLLEVMPFLDIRGIDLSIPTEIKPGNVESNDKPVETKPENLKDNNKDTVKV